MADKEFKIYKRNHNYFDPSEVEKGKIKKETVYYLKHRKKSRELSKHMLRSIKRLSHFEESPTEEIQEEDVKSNKEKGNAKTHKKRFKRLKRFWDSL